MASIHQYRTSHSRLSLVDPRRCSFVFLFLSAKIALRLKFGLSNSTFPIDITACVRKKSRNHDLQNSKLAAEVEASNFISGFSEVVRLSGMFAKLPTIGRFSHRPKRSGSRHTRKKKIGCTWRSPNSVASSGDPARYTDLSTAGGLPADTGTTELCHFAAGFGSAKKTGSPSHFARVTYCLADCQTLVKELLTCV